MDLEVLCTICNKQLQNKEDEISEVKERGLQNFINKSKEREDNKWHLWVGLDKLSFHEVCRKRYSSSSSKPTKRKRTLHPEARESWPAPHTMSSTSGSSSSSTFRDRDDFSFATLCFLCEKMLHSNHKKGHYLIVHRLKEMNVRDRLMDIALRKNDENSQKIFFRLQDIVSL